MFLKKIVFGFCFRKKRDRASLIPLKAATKADLSCPGCKVIPVLD
jgi:hypothetical protein